MPRLLLICLAALPVMSAESNTEPAPPVRAPAIRAPRIPPPEVRRGDRVAVLVSSGSVQLKFEAETESAGHIGETVIVKNPENGRRFVAKVEDIGKVVVKK